MTRQRGGLFPAGAPAVYTECHFQKRLEDGLKVTGDRSNGDRIALQEGEAHAGLGEHEQAISDFDRSEAFLRKSGNLRYYADLLQQRSRSYEALGKT